MDYLLFNYGFSLFNIMFFIMFILISSLVIINLIKSFKQWSYNNSQPILDVNCKVISKRTQVNTHHHNSNDSNYTTNSTTYYVTFEFLSKDRLEFNVSGKEYGLLKEGDEGILKFQGSRFLGFNRQI